MPDLSAIATILSSLNAAKDIAQGMINLRDAAAFQSKLLEFQSKLLDANNAALAAQDERASLLEQIRTLEKEIDELRAWDAEKERYQLTEIGPAAFAYVVKEDARGAEPVHCICAECFQRGQKSILQCRQRSYGTVMLGCPRCTSQVRALDSHPGYPFKGHQEERVAGQRRLNEALNSPARRNPFGRI
jgi:hypothetical protein